jgi:hypothetical protein
MLPENCIPSTIFFPIQHRNKRNLKTQNIVLKQYFCFPSTKFQANPYYSQAISLAILFSSDIALRFNFPEYLRPIAECYVFHKRLATLNLPCTSRTKWFWFYLSFDGNPSKDYMACGQVPYILIDRHTVDLLATLIIIMRLKSILI